MSCCIFTHKHWSAVGRRPSKVTLTHPMCVCVCALVSNTHTHARAHASAQNARRLAPQPPLCATSSSHTRIRSRGACERTRARSLRSKIPLDQRIFPSTKWVGPPTQHTHTHSDTPTPTQHREWLHTHPHTNDQQTQPTHIHTKKKAPANQPTATDESRATNGRLADRASARASRRARTVVRSATHAHARAPLMLRECVC